MSKHEKEVVNQDEVKRLAAEQFAKEEAEIEKKLAVEAEVKRLRAEKEKEIRVRADAVHKENHANAIKGIRQFHGNVMRTVGKRYSADSKPFYVDKGV